MRTVFVEADILGELSHLSCVDYIMQDPRIQAAVTNGLTKEDVLGTMTQVGFKDDGKAKPNHPGINIFYAWSSVWGLEDVWLLSISVSSLSGGWRMKLALARAMLQRADILLLDEVNFEMHTL